MELWHLWQDLFMSDIEWIPRSLLPTYPRGVCVRDSSRIYLDCPCSSVSFKIFFISDIQWIITGRLSTYSRRSVSSWSFCYADNFRSIKFSEGASFTSLPVMTGKSVLILEVVCGVVYLTLYSLQLVFLCHAVTFDSLYARSVYC
jgi:hypothetical protein